MKKKKLKICIIGIGNIGYHHLCGILKNSKFLEIIAIDKNKKRFSEIKKKFSTKFLLKKKIILNFTQQINFKNYIIDFLILATTSDVRLKLIKQVIKKNKIKNILVEKIAASSFKEYRDITKILSTNKINNYINFPRREYKVYKYIKQQLIDLGEKKIHISYIGKNWNLASNVFHLSDLMCFLTNQKKIQIKMNKLKNTIFKSSRKSFLELKGKIVFKNNRGSTLVCEDLGYNKKKYFSESQPIKIETKNLIFKVYENLNKLSIYFKNKSISVKKKIKIPKQSELTFSFMKKILKNETNLPSYNDFYYIHQVLLNALIKHIKNNLLRVSTKIKIT